MKQGRTCQVPKFFKKKVLEDLGGTDHFLLGDVNGEGSIWREPDGWEGFGQGLREDAQWVEQIEHEQRTAKTSTWLDSEMKVAKGVRPWRVPKAEGSLAFVRESTPDESDRTAEEWESRRGPGAGGGQEQGKPLPRSREGAESAAREHVARTASREFVGRQLV